MNQSNPTQKISLLTKLLSQRRTKPIVFSSWLAAFIILTVIYFLTFHVVPRNSDSANATIAGYEMFHGNPLLKHWTLPTDNLYTTDLALSGLLEVPLGFSSQVMFIVPALLWSLVSLFSIQAVLSAFQNSQNRIPIAGVAVVLSLIALPLFIGSITKVQSLASYHIGTLACTLGAFLLSRRILLTENPSRAEYLLVLLIIAIAVLSDPMALASCVLPILLTTAILWLSGGARQRLLSLSVITIAGVISGIGCLWLIKQANGFYLGEFNTHLTTLESLGKSLYSALQGAFDVFGSNFFGRALRPRDYGSSTLNYIADGPAVRILRMLLLMLVVGATFNLGKRIFLVIFENGEQQDKSASENKLAISDCLLYFCFWSALLMFLATVFTEFNVDIQSGARFMLPALVCATIIGAIELEKKGKLVRYYLIAVLIANVAAFSAGYCVLLSKSPFHTDERYKIANWLQAHGFKNGYGPYWTVNLVTALTSNAVKARALVPEGDVLVPRLLLSNQAWYGRPAPGEKRFVLVSHLGDSYEFTGKQVIATLGTPAKIYTTGAYDVYVYDTSRTDFSKLVINLPSNK